MTRDERKTKAQLIDEIATLRDRVADLEAGAARVTGSENGQQGQDGMFSTLAENIPAGLFIYQYRPPDRLTLLYGNPEAASLTGVVPEEWIGREFDEIWPEAEAQGVTGAFLEVMRSGTSYQTEDLRYEDEALQGAFRIHAFPLEGSRLAVSFENITQRKAMEEALRESEERFRMLFDRAPLGYQSLDEEGRLIDVNQAWLDLLGHERGEVLGRSFGDFLAPEFRERFQERFPRFKKDGRIQNVEFDMVRSDGTTALISIDGRIGHDSTGRFKQTHCILQNITERRKAEEALSESEARLRAVVEDQTEMIVRWLPDGVRTFVNTAYCRAFGGTPNTFVGSSFFPMIAEDDREQVLKRIERISLNSPVTTAEHRVVRPDGTLGWQEWTDRGLFDQDGTLIEYQSVGRDITERRELEEKLRRTQFTVDNSPDAVFWLEPDGGISEANQAASQLTGFPSDDLLSLGVYDLDPAISRKTWPQVWARISRVGSFRQEAELQRADETRIPVELLVTYSEFEGQEHAVVVIRDITERKKWETKIQESERRFRTLTASSPVGIFQIDPEGRRTYVNKRGCEMAGIDPEDPDAADWWECIHPEDRPKIREDFRRILDSARGWVQEFRYLTPDGRETWVYSQGSPLLGKDGTTLGYMGTNVDITERMEAEAASRVSEERYRKLFEMGPNGTALVAVSDGRFIDVNERFCETFGYTREEVIGRTATDMELVTPEERVDLLGQLREKGGAFLRELRFKAKGEERTFLASAEFLEQEGEMLLLWELVDITERKRLEARLLQSQKLETLGTLAGGIAHDFNNLLVPILGYADLVHQGLSPDDPVVKELESHLFDSTDRARELVKQILTFGREEGDERKVLQPAGPVRNALRLLDATLPSSISIRRRFTEPLPSLLADGNHLQQVVANLCTNAAHAMQPAGGVLEVSLETVQVDESFVEGHPNFEGPEAVLLTVRDSGEGMKPEVLERVFEPFYTTKEVGEGSGLGLSVVHGIVTGHGGVIEVESALGEGSTFKVYLPTCGWGAPSEDPGSRPAPRGTERILFVDDEDAACVTAKHLLESLGYRIVTFTDGLTALERLSEDPEAFDVVVTDFDMPRMNGIHLGVEMMEIRPDLPVLLLTGTHEGRIRAAEGLGFRGYVRKPFTGYELSSAIRDALGE